MKKFLAVTAISTALGTVVYKTTSRKRSLAAGKTTLPGSAR